VGTDQAQYAPGSTVSLTGGGWVPADSIHIVVSASDGSWQHTADATADSGGAISDQFQLPSTSVASYSVTVTDQTNGTDSAQTSFTDPDLVVFGLLPGPNLFTVGQPATVGVFVFDGVNPGVQVTGSLTFTSQGTVLCANVPLASSPLVGQPAATCTTSSLPAGQNAIHVTYAGPPQFFAPGGFGFGVTVQGGDTTPPVSTASAVAADGSEYANGSWTAQPSVSVTISATDSEPGGTGVASITYSETGAQTAAQTTMSGSSMTLKVSAEGSTDISWVSTDGAGNTEQQTQHFAVRIDTTPPNTSCAPSPDPTWHADNVTVSCQGFDTGSGLASTADASFSLSTSVTAGSEAAGALTESRMICDAVGHCTTIGPFAFNVDRAAPTVSCETSSIDFSKWYAANQSINCTASDGGSGLANPSDNSFTVSTSVASGSADASASTGTRHVCDNAGNCATAGPYQLKIDLSAPQAVCQSAQFLLHQPSADVTASVTDTGSGASQTTASASADTSQVTLGGVPRTVTVTATDDAGNSTSTSCPYTVVYNWKGFNQPINDRAYNPSEAPSVFKAGSTVPAKFQLYDYYGNAVQEPGSDLPGWVSPQKGNPLSSGASVDETVYAASSTSGSNYRLDPTVQQYIFNYNTAKSQTGYFWRLGATLDDGTTHYVSIGLL
jgi:hypothetical protein